MSRSSSTSRGSRSCCARLARRPPVRLSMTRTRMPRAKHKSTVWLPMNPAPPVTIAIGSVMRGGSGALERLQSANVVIALVVERIRQQPLRERLAHVAHGVFDGERRRKPELAADLVRIDVVTARIVRFGHVDADGGAIGKLL